MTTIKLKKLPNQGNHSLNNQGTSHVEPGNPKKRELIPKLQKESKNPTQGKNEQEKDKS